jgi:PAS domain S-box-containing protein
MDYQIDYRGFYEDSPDMLFSVEARTGKIIECNRTLLTCLGYAKNEILGKNIIELYHPDYLEKVKENFQSFKNTGRLIHSEFQVLKKDGETIEVTIKLTPVCDEQGNILYSNAALRDITELKEMQRIIQLEKEKSENLLLNIIPRSIAERLKQNPSVIADGIPSSTILFSDIVGFTNLAEHLLPEELIHLLNTIFSEFDNLVETLGLEKIKTIGDEYMVAAGIPLPRNDHAYVIAELALKMKNAMNKINQDLGRHLNIRIGINSGPVVAGVIGKKKFSYDLWGDSVNTASRMESHGLPGEIQITQATYNLIKDKYNFEDRGEIKVKGKGLMQAYLLKGRKAINSSSAN